MEWVVAIVLTAFNAMVLVHYWRRWRARGFWLLGSSYYLLFGFLQYPVRALVLLSYERSTAYNAYGISGIEIAQALTFYTLFVLVLVVTHDALLEGHRLSYPGEGLRSSGTWALMLLVLCYFAGFAYRIYAGKVYTLYDGLPELYGTSEDGLARLADRLKWLLLPWAAFVYRAGRRRVAAITVGAVVAVSVVESVITTAKGELVALVIMLVYMGTYLRRRLSKVAIAVLATGCVLFGVYSYLARSFGDVRGEFEFSKVAESLETVRSSWDSNQAVGWRGVINRFNYLDGLALAIRRGPGGEDPYEAGSLVEVAMLVPRALWADRPHFSFNHHVTGAVWGEPFFSETPIGRAGEAYYVLGWAGLLIAAFYGWMFAKIERVLVCRGGGFARAVGVFTMFVLVLPDAYLTYGWKVVAYLSPIVAVGWFVNRRQIGPRVRPPTTSMLRGQRTS